MPIKNNDSKDVQALVNALLKQTQNASVQAYELDNCVYIESDEDIGQKLQAIFNDPQTLRTNLQYTLNRAETGNSNGHSFSGATQYAAYDGMSVFNGLFGHDYLVSLGLGQDVQKHFTDTNHLVQETSSGDAAKVRQVHVALLQSRLSNKEPKQAFKALGISDDMPTYHKEDGSPVLLSDDDEFDKVLTTEQQGNQLLFKFDYKLLAQIAERLVAPKPTVDTVVENQQTPSFVYAIDKIKFLNYLKTSLDDQLVLRFEDDDNATPIMFHPAKSQAKTNLFELVLDCSGSMQSVFEEYINKVQHFISELNNQQNTAGYDIVRIVPFNNNIIEQKEISLGDITAINEYLGTLKADYKTYFFGSLDQELNIMKDKCHDHNVTMVVFSDGQDNMSLGCHQRGVAERMAELKRDVKPPKVITFGLGDQYQKQTMEDLADNCGFQHHHLNNIKDFKTVYDYVETAGLESVVFRLYQQAEHAIQLYEGQVKACDATINTNEPFTFNQQRYSVQTHQHKQQAVENTANESRVDEQRQVENQTQSGLSVIQQGLFGSGQQRAGQANEQQQANEEPQTQRNQASGSCVMQ